jgi:hypothetical protein
MLTASRRHDVPWNRNYMRPDNDDQAQDARHFSLAQTTQITTVDYSKLKTAKTT